MIYQLKVLEMAYAYGHPKVVPPGATRNISCIAEQTALLVIDVQEYCSRPGRGCHQGVRRELMEYFFDRVDHVMVPNIAQLLLAARRAGVEVLYTVIEALTSDGRDGSLDYKLSGPLFVPKGHPDAAVLPEIAPRADEIILPKTSCSVFCSTSLHYILRNLGTRFLILCGQLTNQCVESAVRDAADLGYLVSVPEDACAAKSSVEHESALQNLKGFARLIKTEDLVAELKGQVVQLCPVPNSPRLFCHLAVALDDPWYGAHAGRMVEELLREVAEGPFQFVDFDVKAGKLPTPEEAARFAGFLLLGSPASVSAGVTLDSWLQTLIKFARDLLELRRPLLGICFGHQVIARALGGVVAVNPAGPQVSSISRKILPGARRSLGLPEEKSCLSLFYHHSDAVVALPPGAESWGYGPSGHWGMSLPNCLTTQAHPEFRSRRPRLREAMGAQLGLILSAGNFLIGSRGLFRGLKLYSELPEAAAVPLRFGLLGEVLWSSPHRYAYLIYPALCAGTGLLPFVAALRKEETKVPAWARDEEAFRVVKRVAEQGISLGTGLLLLAIQEQVPAIVRGQQDGLQPELMSCFLLGLGGFAGACAVAIHRLTY